MVQEIPEPSGVGHVCGETPRRFRQNGSHGCLSHCFAGWKQQPSGS